MAQSTFVIPVAGKPDVFIFMADRWNKSDLTDSRYVWLPLEFKDQAFRIPWRDAWRLNASKEDKTANLR